MCGRYKRRSGSSEVSRRDERTDPWFLLCRCSFGGRRGFSKGSGDPPGGRTSWGTKGDMTPLSGNPHPHSNQTHHLIKPSSIKSLSLPFDLMHDHREYGKSDSRYQDERLYCESVYSENSENSYNSDTGSVGGLSTVSDLRTASNSNLLLSKEDWASGTARTPKKKWTMGGWFRNMRGGSMRCGDSYRTDFDPSRVKLGLSRNSSASAAPSSRASMSEKRSPRRKPSFWSKANSLRSDLKDRYKAWTMTPEECPLRRSPLIT